MAESIVRKIQPFTIGTKLSVPTGPKCPHFTESYLPNPDLDNCQQHSQKDQVCLYLGGAQRGPRLSPVAAQVSRLERQQVEPAEVDHLNRNAGSVSTSSRAIRKIAISGSAEHPGDTKAPLGVRSKTCGTPKSENININNNNNIPSKPLPRIVGVSCENKPNTHFKVLLRKDGRVGRQGIEEDGSCGTSTRPSLAFQNPILTALSSNREQPKVEGPPCGHPEAPPPNDGCFIQRNALFNRELLQAEEWMKVKLQELRDTQRRPLQEGLTHTLQKDLRDFENTLIQLNQMGEQLLCKLNPAADQVRKQLGQLRDQWQTLKQAAASQSKALGGARNLQEFNRKVDRLEAWIKEKQEEEQWLAKFQGENIDRMQLTRRILDLKEDEQLYRSLHDEINQLALKLEKQGKTEGKNISTRRKHINKMWLKVQSLLKDYHETLQLALEVSSFYQQADNIICAISNKRKSVCVRNERESSGDREIREIGSQVMMLDVTVSQLSKLHPALAVRVLQKQREVKEGWALLQRAVRNEKSVLPATSPDFSREDHDPLTLSKEPQCSMGAETQRIMGKEIKEEQNRLKGHVNVGNPERNRKEEELLLKSHAPSGTGSGSAHADDITGGNLSRMERKQMSQSKPCVTRGHPQQRPQPRPQPRPQLHTQLQKFAMSADKTLSWLKDNVAMATQVCCTASLDGFEAAKQRQAALEQEIQSNRARIEVVKKEGRSLVQAGHPGSRKIEEFLGQLEALWEELKRRHRKNLLLLQETERLSLEAVRMLVQLDGLDRWLHAVETSLQSRWRARDGEAVSVSAAERESSALEREVSEHGLQLRLLRQEVDGLRSRRHFHTQRLQLRLEQVEQKYRRVQCALTQQSSELQDTRMLTEFLERVELEESQEQQGSRYGDLAQTLHSEISSRASLLGLRGDGGGAGEPLMESMGDPVEELREAVEMLNDTVRERGRSLYQDQGLHELLSRHSSLTARIAQRLSRAAQLSADVQGAESDMAVRCEPERCGLEALQEQQEELETDLALMDEEVEETMKLAARLEEQCPERVQVLAAEFRATLQAWDELRGRAAENHARLRQFQQLRGFFRNYLAMISWTEDTRACIFSESTVHDGTGSEHPEASEMDVKIEQKFKDFDDLAVAGQNLMHAGHHLTDLIQERMEELRSMLGWILVRWRSQKHQKKNGSKEKAEPKGDAIYSEATHSPVQPEVQRLTGTPANQQAAGPGCHDDALQTEGGYEVMSSVGPRGGASDTPTPPLLLKQEPGVPSLGGTVNLILSFAKTGDSLQAEPPVAEKGATEPVHRVSTYLHVKDSKACGSVTLPRPSCQTQLPASSSSSSSSSSCSPPRAGHASGHAPPGSGGGSSIFSGLKLRSKKKKRKRDVRRHTIQRIMGLEQPEEGVACSTHTWPLRENRKEAPDAERTDYLRNPLARDIDAECPAQSDFTASLSACSSRAPPAGSGRHCRHLSLGSVLTFDLQKDVALIPSTPDIITIGPAELNRSAGGPQTERSAPFSTFKQTRSVTDRLRPQAQEEASLQKDSRSSQNTSVTIQSMGTLTTDQSVQRQTTSSNYQPDQRQITSSNYQSDQRETSSSNYPLDQRQTTSSNYLSDQRQTTSSNYLSEQRQTTSSNYLSEQGQTTSSDYLSDQRQTTPSDDLLDLQLSRLSGISSLHEEVVQEWDKLVAVLDIQRHDPKSSALSAARACPSDRNIPSPHTAPPYAPAPPPAVSRDPGGAVMADAVHPDRRQFEEEEEELEGIWSQTSSYRQSICSDIMYQTYQGEALACTPPGHAQEPRPQDQALLYRKQITASAPSLLSTEPRLGNAGDHAQLGSGSNPNPRQNRSAKPDRKSWAAFPSRAPASGEIPLENETAAGCVRLPDIQDQEKYIYQYREEEEEEEEEEGVEAELGAEVDTGCPKVQSMSLLSVHMGGGPNAAEREEQGPSRTVGGRCGTTGPEFQSMEGTLERKHRLQLGGKKAPCRTWSTSHAVLYRQTLSFYQDRKDTLRSSVTGLPLNLVGAECSPCLEYTKKSNCFSLRLRDGSEYLLSASSRFLMKKWLLKIQANTGLSESDPSRSFSEPGLLEDLPATIRAHTGTAKHKEIVLTRAGPQSTQRHHGNLEDLSPRLSLDAGHSDSYSSLRRAVKQKLSQRPKAADASMSDSLGRPSSKRRSQSFTSATYQKISPVRLHPAARQGGGSSYSVTLVIGDEATPTGSETPWPIGWRQDPFLDSPGGRSYVSLPRPRNKSVFRRFFGKKEWTHDL
ncbi:hypothetical protein SKAU_G00179540 [Synaphobranchus kaupii]|uniref:PH domain-containing protein n=1 Tax=Synaphobranchus kaupii TaxID=118154 RepID=A0A9Q1FM09_SYNKA|nr:hypothetical protein SKAU_G00179540 [Synaphobranchus kaupii]